MKRIILTCGLIGGLISVGWFLLSEQLLTLNISMNARMFFGYATMIVGLSVIFAGIKNYRDNYNDGVISFVRGLKIGLLITLVASTIYVIVWMIDYTFFVPDFFDKYKAMMLADMKAQGAGAAEIQAKMAETDNYVEMYRNPLVNIMFTYMEIVPVGLVISIVASLILKRRQKPIDAA